MNAKAHMVGFVIGLLATPIALLLAMLSTGAGHGNYLWAILLFPLTMLSTAALGSITAPFVLLAVIQYPIYGWIVGNALRPEKSRLGMWLVLTIHLVSLALFFLIPNPGFRR